MDYKSKDISLGFVILCPEHNMGKIKTTFYSIQRKYKEGTPIVCVVAKGTKNEVVKEISQLCPCYRGGKTITSLINTGIKKGNWRWNHSSS